jgi:hypothetical protein
MGQLLKLLISTCSGRLTACWALAGAEVNRPNSSKVEAKAV